ncbi:GSTA2 transferase, partial [Chauna torquata]|nr:GSTA2 transferase [Chauna torquata]
QVPLVEIDGMKTVQTRAILSYIAGKYNLYGKDLKERALTDTYVEGITDLMQMILMFAFSPPEAKEKNLASIAEKATKRYFSAFAKVSDSAEVPVKLVLTVIKKFPKDMNILAVQAFKMKMSNMPTIKKSLQPGSRRKPPPDERYVATVMEIFKV